MYNLRNRRTRKLTKRCCYGCCCGESGKSKHSGKSLWWCCSASNSKMADHR